MSPTYVVIPYKDEPDLTMHVTGLCLKDPGVNHVLLYDNGSSLETKEIVESRLKGLDGGSTTVAVIDADGMGIYEMWNAGWRKALASERGQAVQVAFLNNDIDFLPGLIEQMATTLRLKSKCLVVYPDYDRPISEGVDRSGRPRQTQGTKKDGGMCGHCFMVKGEAAEDGLSMFDEEYEWWGGDDHFARTVEAYSAHQYRLVGWPCDHVNEGTANNGANEWTNEAKSRDIQRLIDKWGYF